jgi:UDP-glucose 4-epimerase
MNILITGGAGYIGSHACVTLLENGYKVIVIDNLSNSSAKSLERVKKITGKQVEFFHGDLCNKADLEDIFQTNKIDAVMHFAGLKSVKESVQQPLKYYHNNIGGSLVLLETMNKHQVKNLVFSSSCTVYGNPDVVPVKEDSPTKPFNPYGRTKLYIEEMLKDLYLTDDGWKIASLRYFNPIGAHPSGLIGEDPIGIPDNLLPYISRVAVRQLQELSVFGNDYSTPDGTCIRDYIHVMDLVEGHLKALEKISRDPGMHFYNLGTGTGYTVLQVIEAFKRATDQEVPFKIVGRRPGDIPVVYADPSFAAIELDWRTERGLDEMCADTWRWQSMNPKGY